MSLFHKSQSQIYKVCPNSGTNLKLPNNPYGPSKRPKP